MLSTLSVISNRFRFSADMDEYSELAVRAFNEDFPKFPKWSPSEARFTIITQMKSLKSIENHSF